MTADHVLTKNQLKFIEELCIATWEPLYRFVYFKVQNREEAEDITQETYVKTLQYLSDHNISEENLPGFVHTIAHNILRDRWRQKQRQGGMVNVEEIHPLASAGKDEQEAIVQRMEVKSAMDKLREEYRAVLDLRILKGYSVSETAKLLGKTEAAIRTAQYRALQSLAQILDSNN